MIVHSCSMGTPVQLMFPWFKMMILARLGCTPLRNCEQTQSKPVPSHCTVHCPLSIRVHPTYRVAWYPYNNQPVCWFTGCVEPVVAMAMTHLLSQHAAAPWQCRRARRLLVTQNYVPMSICYDMHMLHMCKWIYMCNINVEKSTNVAESRFYVETFLNHMAESCRINTFLRRVSLADSTTCKKYLSTYFGL